ncbi:aldehyde dehydrogenase family protein [Massilioclostridium coli]|uniref:aldehyde dehydrogenase family protein n=1 Tax=Massilioclostridium coli TaxID=1870991 RepID=UPI0022E475D1|nr:aldehyde dehydrogenase family protein [Massilioclostridium coli]
MEFSQNQIDSIVQSVVAQMQGTTPASAPAYDSTQYNGRQYLGVYATMEEGIDAAADSYKVIRNMSVEQREKIITEIRKLTRAEAEIMAKLGVEETKMGRVEHKTLKHILVADKTPGTEDIQTEAQSGDGGLTLVEMAPFGIIGAITPSTNPSETVICNSIAMIAAGNAVVFNPHPGAIKVSNYAVDLVNRASLAAGGPASLVCSMVKPTMQTADVMYKDPRVRMLVCTGGPGVVKSVLSSGKKAIGAGAGNPPVIVDDTADIKKAAKDIIDGCTFDNNLPCIAEKEVFAFSNIADELMYNMQQNGAYFITAAQADELAKIVLVEKKNEKTGKITYSVSRDWVGRDAKKFAAALGIEVDDSVRCLICEVEEDHLFVQTELMMPILAVVRVKDIDEAIEKAVRAEHGNRHSAHMHSKNIENLSKFAKAIETTIFVKNAPSYAGIGFGAEGHTTFTIAGPTGEGLTSARSFTRKRRCVMKDMFHII